MTLNAMLRKRLHLSAVFTTLLTMLSPAGSAAEAAKDSRSGAIEREADCFSGSFATYESWRTMLGQRRGAAAGRMDPREAAAFERYKSELQCRWILYTSSDGQLVNGFTITPKRVLGTAERLPAVIYNRGGNAEFGIVIFGQFMLQHFALAAEGFVVVGSQYRGTRPAFLMDRDPGRDEFGGADVKDVLSLLDVLRNMPNADMDRVGMFGWSRGGMQTFLAARHSSDVRAIVVGGAVTDLEDALAFRPEMKEVYEQRIPGYATDTQALLRQRSAIRWAEELPSTAPILLLHGLSDDRVPARQAIALSQRLQELGRPHELVLIGGGDHGLMRHNDHVNELIAAWFKRHLAPRSLAAPSAQMSPL